MAGSKNQAEKASDKMASTKDFEEFAIKNKELGKEEKGRMSKESKNHTGNNKDWNDITDSEDEVIVKYVKKISEIEAIMDDEMAKDDEIATTHKEAEGEERTENGNGQGKRNEKDKEKKR